MKLNAATQVGIVTVLGFGVLVVGLGWLADTSLRPHGYRLRAEFSDVNGLLPGANVMLMGVRVGRVVDVVPADHHVVVDLEIRNAAVRIAEGSHFKILNKGLIGEKNLEIFAPDATPDATTAYLQAGAVVHGDTPPRLDTAIEQADRAIRSLRALADSPETKLAVKEGVRDFKEAFKEIRALIVHTDEVARGAQTFVETSNRLASSLPPEEIAAMVHDLRTLSSGLRRSYETLAGGQGANQSDAQASLANVRKITERVEGIAADLQKFTADPKLKNDLKDLVASSRRVMSQVSGVTGKPPQLSPRFDLNVVEAPDKSYVAGNFNMGLRLPNDAFVGGIESLGQDNLLNLTWGKPDFFTPGVGFHLGMVRSKIGAGLDWTPLENLDTSGELYSPLSPTLRLQASYYPDWWRQKYGLTAQWIRDLSVPNSDQYILGIQWRPID